LTKRRRRRFGIGKHHSRLVCINEGEALQASILGTDLGKVQGEARTHSIRLLHMVIVVVLIMLRKSTKNLNPFSVTRRSSLCLNPHDKACVFINRFSMFMKEDPQTNLDRHEVEHRSSPQDILAKNILHMYKELCKWYYFSHLHT